MNRPHGLRKAKKTKSGIQPKHPKSYLANLATMKLLVTEPEFQAVVAETRRKLGIPEGGLKTNDAIRIWNEAYLVDCDKIMEDKEYRERGRALTTEYRAGKLDYEGYNRRMDAHNEEIPVNYRRAQERRITQQFNLPEHFREHVGIYILRGDITAPYHNFVLGPWGELRWDEKFSTVRHIPVTYYTTPTQEDIRLAKREVAVFAKMRGLPRYGTMKNVERDLKIEEWYQNPERLDSVEQKTYETTTAEIAQEHLGSAKKAPKVRHIVREIKRARKKRFLARGKK